MSRRGRPVTAPPWPVAVPAAIALAFLALPILGLLVRAPWGRMAQILTSPASLDALRLSLVTSTSATVLAVVVGVPLAWVLARGTFAGRRLLRALVTVPLVLPPVVGGIALLLAFGRAGIVGQYLYSCCGVSLPFTTPGVVVAQTFVALPFLVITLEGALRSLDTGLEDAAATLGAGRLTVFRRVTVPLVLPSIAAGVVLTFARALGEFGATITFAGNLQGVTRTLPLAAYLGLETDPSEAVALSLVLLAVSVAVLVALRDRWLRTGVAS
ncbi:MAG: molybdate ABC transporter permease subunit [Frankiales bacterium]|nr:molybdate ABC transporter permease subunit [Frankiales bacterium]